MFKLVLEKAEEQRSNCQHPSDHRKSKRVPEKYLLPLLLTVPKPLTVWTTTNFGQFFKRWEYQTTWPASWEISMHVRKQQLELDMEKQTGSKWGKEYCQGCILSPCLFNFYAEYIMWNARLDEAQTGIEITGRNINNLIYMQMNHPYGRKWRTKEALDESERGEGKSWLKAQHSEN